MAWGKIIAMAADTWLQTYEYELKVTDLFMEILSNISFANFILQSSEDLKTMGEWLKWYDKAIKAYSYYLLLPAIAKLGGDQIARDPNLNSYYSNFPDYVNIRNRILQEGEADGEDLEGIAETFRNFFSPIVKGYMEFTGTVFTFLRDLLNAGAYTIWDIARNKNFNVVSVIQTILERYRKISYQIRTANIPPEFYYQQRPTYDFDIVILFAHVESYMAYTAILEKKVAGELSVPLSNELTAKIWLGDKKITEVKLTDLNKIKFCIDKATLDEHIDDEGFIEMG